jgi:hypothetical protein
MFLKENNNVITVIIMTLSIINNEETPLKGCTGSAREFKIKRSVLIIFDVSYRPPLTFNIAHFVRYC